MKKNSEKIFCYVRTEAGKISGKYSESLEYY